MLSIDITDRQIKLVRGVHSGSKIRVQDADMRELTLGMVSNGYITDVPMVAAELNDIIKTKGITEKDAIVSITSSSIVYKEMLLPKPKSLKNTAAIEAMIQSNMGVSKEFNISFTIAGETEDEEKNKMIKIIATACPQRLVDGYVRLFSHIGLSLKAVNISNNSVTRLIVNTPKMADRMPMLLIQIDKGFLNMNLYEDNQIVFSRFFNVDPADYDNAPDYVIRAVYDNLFRMIQFIKSRKGAKPLKEIMFYGDTGNFIELSNAISSFNVPTHVLATPSTGYLLALGASCVGAVVLVGAITLGLGAFDNAIKSQISDVQQQINNPTLQNDLEIVSNREQMLAGFQSYNDSVGQTSQLFNYMPKAQSYVIDKLKEPIDSIVNDDVELDLLSVSISDYSVSATFMGRSNGDPTPIPSDYVEKLIKDVKTKYGDS